MHYVMWFEIQMKMSLLFYFSTNNWIIMFLSSEDSDSFVVPRKDLANILIFEGNSAACK